MIQQQLEKLGWNPWFDGLLALEDRPLETVARVAAVDREQLLLLNTTGTFRARLSGSYLHHHRRTEELPCVGDWVCVEKGPQDEAGLIHSLLDRRTSLQRKAVGSAGEAQMIAANLDYVIIVQSCHFDFNLNRLDRHPVPHRMALCRGLLQGDRPGRRPRLPEPVPGLSGDQCRYLRHRCLSTRPDRCITGGGWQRGADRLSGAGG